MQRYPRRGIVVMGLVALLMAVAGIGSRGRTPTDIWQVATQFGGAVYAVAAAPPYLYVGVGPRLLVLDISQPERPRPVGQSAILPGVVRALALHQHLALVATGMGGLQVLDIADPTQPKVLAGYDTGGYLEDLAVAGEVVYLASTPRWDGTNGVGDGLQVVDLSEPQQPKPLGSVLTPGYEHAVATAGAFLVVADGDGGLQVLEASHPAAPQTLGAYATPGYALDVATDGKYAYVAAFTAGLRVVDISDPAHAKEVGFVELPGQAWHVTLADDGYAYVGGGEAGLHIVALAEPTAPRLVATFTAGGDVRRAAVVGDIAFVADRAAGLRVVGLKDRTAPQPISTFDTLGYVSGIAVVGDGEKSLTVYAASGGDVRVVEVKATTQPQVTAFYATPGAARDVAVAVEGQQARRLFVADGPIWQRRPWGWSEGGLRVLEPAADGEWREVAFMATPGQALGLGLAWPFVYLADGDGLRVYQATGSAPLQTIEFHAAAGTLRDIALGQGYAFIAAPGQGVLVVRSDRPDPTQPIARIETTPYTRGLDAWQRYLFVVEAVEPGNTVLPGQRGLAHGLRIFDVGHPSTPVETGRLETPGDIQNVAAAAGLLVVADGDGGLLVLRLTP